MNNVRIRLQTFVFQYLTKALVTAEPTLFIPIVEVTNMFLLNASSMKHQISA